MSGKYETVYGRIKELHMGRQRNWRILLIIELILLAVGIAGLFGKDEIYEYGQEAMQCNFGTYSEEYGGIVTFDTEGSTGYMVDFKNIALPRGTYRIQLHYITDTSMRNLLELTNDSLEEYNFKCNGTLLFAGLDQTDVELWLLRDSDQTEIHAYYSGEGMLAVQGVTIRRTNAWNRILLFIMVCLFGVVNTVCVYWQYDRKYHIAVKNKNIVFALGIIILFTALPVLSGYMLSTGDLLYHLMRVEGIRDGISNGQFPVRISPEWQQGYGYASPVFYGETILYLAGFFRLLGFTVTTSCCLFLFVIAAATVLISYGCFAKMFGEPYVGVFCSMLYSLSIYRIFQTYCKSSWGECLGIMLLPLIVYGFYRIVTQDIHEKNYSKSWLPLAVGLALLVQSHLLTGEIVGLFVVILCVVLWKKVFRVQTFLALAKAALYSILFSAWFLVPFADYMITGDFVIHHVSERTIQYRGLYPAHLLFTHFINGETVFFDQDGMYQSPPAGVGIVLIAGLVLFLLLSLKGENKGLSCKEKKLGYIAGFCSVIAMLMSLSLFPWDRIQSLGGIAKELVSKIQMPYRFLTIANVGLTVVAGLVLKCFLDRKNKMLTACYVGGMMLLLGCGSIYLMEQFVNGQEPLRVHNSQGMGTGYISGAEYLPYKADPSQFVYHDPVCTGSLEYSDYRKLSLGAEAYLSNRGQETESAAFSLLYYKGYRAFHVEDGQELNCYSGDNCEVTVEIPAGFEGRVQVKFVSPWYWRAGEAVTVLTVGCMAAFGLWQRRRSVRAKARQKSLSND